MIVGGFRDAPEGGLGTVDIDGEYLYLVIDNCQELGDYSDILTSFLYMEDDEITRLIKDDIAAEDGRKRSKKAARISKEKEQKELRKSASAKLTKAELKALTTRP